MAMTGMYKVVRHVTLNNGIRLKRGQLVQLSPLAMHHHSDQWPDSKVFNPSRFDSESPSFKTKVGGG